MGTTKERFFVDCQFLIAARERKGLTQEQVAKAIIERLEKVGMVDNPVRNYARYESGDVNKGGGFLHHKGRWDTLGAIAQVLDVTVEQLLGRDAQGHYKDPDAALAMLNRYEQWDALKNSVLARTAHPVLTFLIRAPQEQLLHVFLGRLPNNLTHWVSRAQDPRIRAPVLHWVHLHRAGVSWHKGQVWLDRLLDAVDPDGSDEPSARLQRATERAPRFIVFGSESGLVLNPDEWAGLRAFLRDDWPHTLKGLAVQHPIRLLIPLMEPPRRSFWQRRGPTFQKEYEALVNETGKVLKKQGLPPLEVLKTLDWPSSVDLSQWLGDPGLYSTAQRTGIFSQSQPTPAQISQICRDYEQALKGGAFHSLSDLYDWLRFELMTVCTTRSE